MSPGNGAPPEPARPAAEPAPVQEGDLPELVRRIRERTPARLWAGRAGTSYRTGTQIGLRQAHAEARDAVRDELDLARDLGASLLERWQLFEVSTEAANKDQYLLRPDLGRRFGGPSRSEVTGRCPANADLQIAIGDGLSVTAVRRQVPELLPLLLDGAKQRAWSVGQPFVVRHCRVGVLNEIGGLLRPKVAVLLIGERPGLATAESLSAYMAYEPRENHSDRDRNLISNIHARGVHTREAAERILGLAAQMMRARNSGYTLREAPLGSNRIAT